MKILKYLILLSLIIAGISACETPVCCDPGPEPFRAIVLTQEGGDYLAQNADESVQLYYFENSNKKFLDPEVGLVRDTAYLYEPNIPMKSIQGIKDFYLQVGNDVDTLYVDVAKNNRFKSVKFNGEPAGVLPNTANIPNPAYNYVLIKK